MLRAVTSAQVNWHTVISKAISETDVTSVQLCSYIVEAIRTSGPDQRNANIEELCAYLEANPTAAKVLGDAVRKIVTQSDVTLLLTESGVPGNYGFAKELINRLEQRFIPELEDPLDLRTRLRTIFHHHDDYKWVSAAPDMLWVRLLMALAIGKGRKGPISTEWATSLRILSFHIASLGLQPEITHRLPHLDDANSPFLKLPESVLCFTNASSIEQDDTKTRSCLHEVLETIKACQAQVERLRAEKGIYGTSLRLTSLSFRLSQLLNRLESLLLLTVASENDFRTHLIRLFREVVKAENTRSHVSPHIKMSGDLLAYQVVEHAAKKGSKYITSGREDYWRFFLASLGGGFIVAIFALIKLLLKTQSVPLGVEAVMFGVNYSVCFVIIYLTGSALATKQPAMTANTLARSLERDEQGIHLGRLEDLIVQVWRSQFISFVGNLMMALPVAFVLSILFHQVTGNPLIDESSSKKLLEGIHPWESGALIYASIAGIFLFLSGLVAGWVDNRNLYMKYPERIANHPLLVGLLGSSKARRAGAFIDRNMGIMAGNIVLGFCLGSTATVGEILGLPVDIRHIAFSSAEYGVSLEVLGSTLPMRFVVNAAFGVMLIGLVNFLVSFGLSLAMALESRQIRFGETRRLLWHLLQRLVRRPVDWFFPPGK